MLTVLLYIIGSLIMQIESHDEASSSRSKHEAATTEREEE
jgi:hypothetical protein